MPLPPQNLWSDAFVFLGPTGDLAYKQISPPLQGLIRDEGFNLPIIGVAKAGWTLDHLKARAKDSLEQHGGLDEKVFETLLGLLRYVDGDYKRHRYIHPFAPGARQCYLAPAPLPRHSSQPLRYGR